MTLGHLLDKFLLGVDVHLQPLAELLLVLQLQLLQLLGELSEQLLVLLVQQLLVFLHLLPARLLQFSQRSLKTGKLVSGGCLGLSDTTRGGTLPQHGPGDPAAAACSRTSARASPPAGVPSAASALSRSS